MKTLYVKLVVLTKNVLPGAITFLLIILGATNFQTKELSAFMPMFGVMAVFFWAIYRPQSMPSWLVFLLGIFQDIIYYTPLGTTSFLLLVLWWIITSQRRYMIRESFIVLWLMFLFCTIIYIVSYWLVSSIYAGQLFHSYTIFLQGLFTFLFYPCIHLLYSVINNIGRN